MKVYVIAYIYISDAEQTTTRKLHNIINEFESITGIRFEKMTPILRFEGVAFIINIDENKISEFIARHKPLVQLVSIRKWSLCDDDAEVDYTSSI